MDYLLRGLGSVLKKKKQVVDHLVTDTNTVVVSAHKVLDNLWVGNEAASQNCKWLRENRISVVVNATKHIPFHSCADPHYPKYKYRVPVNDPGPGQPFEQEDNQIMFSALDRITELIHIHRTRGEHVLIHCHAGVQRSAIIAAAYLTKYVLYPRAINKFKDQNPGHALSLENDLNIRRRSMLRALELTVSNRPPAFYKGAYANFRPALDRWVNTWQAPIYSTRF